MDSVEMVELIDPKTQKKVFVNIESGECFGELPPNAYLKQKDAGLDEWWELFDPKHNLPYYYNTTTKATVWVPPTSGMIIPLQAIQVDKINKKIGDSGLSEIPPQNSPRPSETNRYRTESVAKSVKSQHSVRSASRSNDRITENREAVQVVESKLSVRSASKSIDKIPESKSTERVQELGSQSSLGSKGGAKSTPNLAPRNLVTSIISGPIQNPEAAAAMSPFHKSNIAQTQALSLPALNTLHKLPDDLMNDISQFKIDGFAKKYFAVQRKGIFRRKVPLKKVLVYQKDPISGPLLTLAPNLAKDAVKCFKTLQKILGAKGGLMESFTDVQALLEKGIRVGSLRDEILVHSVKQLTNNPKPNQVHRGWQLLSVLVGTFPPSKNLENYLKSFIREKFDLGGAGSELDIIIRFAYNTLLRTCKAGPRGRTLTQAELDQALQAPFKNSVFGDSLERIMQRQMDSGNNSELPVILPALVKTIVRLEGHRSEGIFRVPGDAEGVSDLRCRIDKNDSNFDYLTDPNIPSSLLKLWLRELADPLIPGEFYPACISVGQKMDIKEKEAECLKEAQEIVESLPPINRAVCKFMLDFLRMVAEPQNQPFTKMTAANVAMVFAPNFVRCPSDDPVVIFENTKFEQAFLRILIS